MLRLRLPTSTKMGRTPTFRIKGNSRDWDLQAWFPTRAYLSAQTHVEKLWLPSTWTILVSQPPPMISQTNFSRTCVKDLRSVTKKEKT